VDVNAISAALVSLAISLVVTLVVLVIACLVHIRGEVKQRLAPLMREWISGQNDAESTRQKVVEWATVATTEGVLGLLAVPEQDPDRFAGNGLQMVLDGLDEQQIRDGLQPQLDEEQGKDKRATVRIWIVSVYCLLLALLPPLIGGIRAVGLYREEDSAWASSAFASGLMFLYGSVLFAIIVVLAVKLKHIANVVTLRRQMVVEGLVLISAGQQADVVQERLSSMNLAS
jgi:chemotaxis protein MotA